MNKLEYLLEKRKIIQTDEFKFYDILERLYTNRNIPKPLFWTVAGIGAAMLVKSYTDHWKTEKMFEEAYLNETNK